MKLLKVSGRQFSGIGGNELFLAKISDYDSRRTGEEL